MQNTPNLSNVHFSIDPVNFYGQWVIEEKFNTNTKQKVREFTHTDGRTYVIVKYTQEYTRLERIIRVLLGLALTIIPLIGSKWSPKEVQNLFLKKKKSFKLAVLKPDPTPPAANTPPAPAPAPVPTPADQSMTESYCKVADRGSFVAAMLDQYGVAVNSKNAGWDSSVSLALLSSELQGMINEINSWEKDAQALVQRATSQPKLDDDIQKIKDLEKSAAALQTKHAELLKVLQSKIASQPQQSSVIGLANAGNTCYINSALQPLLALGNFPDLIPEKITQRPDETEENYAGRSAILAALHEFITAWKERKPPNVLGRLIGSLRMDIFQAALEHGMFTDMNEIGRFQDAGQFFTLILHVINREFLQKETRASFLSDDFKATDNSEIKPESIYILYSSASVQQAVNERKNPQRVEADADVEDPRTHQPARPAYRLETRKILGQPPEFLVLQVWPNRIVNPAEDGEVDLSPLFEMQIPPGQANYELVGFSQNHHQVHWTAVVRSGEGWNYCNDASVEPVDPESSEFKCPANFLVYKKRT